MGPDRPATRARESGLPIEVHRGEAGTVFVATCSSEMAALDGGQRRSLPHAPIDGASGDILVTADELLVLAPGGSAP